MKKSFENKESVKSGSVFTFLNQTIGGVKKPVKKPKSQKLTGSKRKDQQIRNQEIHVSISNKKKHIKQLEQQIERNKLTLVLSLYYTSCNNKLCVKLGINFLKKSFSG